MTVMEGVRLGGKGRGRGVLALSSYEPLPRPSKALVESYQQMRQKCIKNPLCIPSPVKPVSVVKPMPVDSIGPEEAKLYKKQNGMKIIAKYNYTANPANPGGFKELTIKQKDSLTLLQKGHRETKNSLWWEVQNEAGESGYVPGNYCLILEDKPSALPWLENKRMEEEKNNPVGGENFFSKPTTTSVKPYKSAYTENNTMQSGQSALKNFYCDICDKQLNGPTPYSMHMASKAHREEVEYQKSST